MVWFVISWVLVGFISFLLMCAPEMRGVPYERCIGHGDGFSGMVLLFVVAGYISLIAVLIVRAVDNEIFPKFVHWLCNIGVKKDDLEAVEE